MKKVVFQGLLTVTLFFAIFFVLNQIDWMSMLKVEHVSQTVDKKLGELYWEFFRESEEEIENITITSALDSILTEICNSNYIDKNKIKLHILENNEVNAFALPDGHIVIYSGLILASESEAEFCGVLCHEIAHIELDHVMKKLVKEVGLSALLSMTTGNNGAEMLNETAKMLSSYAFDRKLEREADIEAVNFLIKQDDGAQMRTIRPVTPNPGSPLYYYAIEHGLIKGIEDFYENKHLNSDLFAANFTDLSEDELYSELSDANLRLLENYFKNKKDHMLTQAKSLYSNRDTSFRGFRQD